MFCNQCEQTAKGSACTVKGVCGKTPETARIQDFIVYALRGLSLVALKAREKNIIDSDIDRLSVKALFSTLTNVNFDDAALLGMLKKVIEAKNTLAEKAHLTFPSGPATLTINDIQKELPSDLLNISTLDENQDVNSLQQILLYGLKGVAAYTDHAAILGQEDKALYTRIYSGLAAGYDEISRSIDDWVKTVLDCGNDNIRAMELLDLGNTQMFGHPQPTEVSLAPVEGKCILVSGHDLKDLYDLLVQTEGTGINIYTHGEMLPAHGYPGLKKFSHLAGHFGTAWQNQQKEFPSFPGAILFTTNCIQRPDEFYAKNVFTTGLVGWPNVTHVPNGNFKKVIEKAKELRGFTHDDVTNGKTTKILTGFGHNAVLNVADTIIEAVKSGDIKHFFLVGGCDGAKPGRNYYTEFVEKTPSDTVVLTLACGKFRFFDKQLGKIGNIPRLLDVGQCNDAFSAVKIALALAKAFDCNVNELPLSFILSWYEQKAVAILLSLFALGVRNIHLGPSLPAFITPNVLDVLVKKFAVRPISTVDEDLQAILKA